MSTNWKYICMMLIKFIEQLYDIPSAADHQPTAATALAMAKSLTEESK
jgi:hypothetical protein